eukprot:TRINITY_DN5685_c0_g1_i6.p1 TRINITY_DN5685_c0_g1~~TRINITY_DN5685_c0_g1_i6.p1  ORF type:complete len:311 (+),score=85.26 TRINITY_DN5685_c0_g1_i6:476-1408(+)
MTYRKNFTCFSNSKIAEMHKCTSDSGWGCMIRSGQMLLSNSLLYHFFGDKFSLDLISKNTEERIRYLSILWEFVDNVKEGVYSIGKVVELGTKYGMKPKDWYGPSMIMRILHKLNKKYHPFPGFQTAYFPEGIIYKSAILEQACNIEKGKWSTQEVNLAEAWTSAILVMVSFRLGINSISPEQHPRIFRLLELPACTGMLGGQKKSALYFLGYQKDKLIFLDPHVTQLAVTNPIGLWSEHLTYHFPTPLRLPITKLDTSIGYGFYLKNYEDYLEFVKVMEKEQGERDSFIQIGEEPVNCNDLDNLVLCEY